MDDAVLLRDLLLALQLDDGQPEMMPSREQHPGCSEAELVVRAFAELGSLHWFSAQRVVNGKSAEESRVWRTMGNEESAARKEEALAKYSRCIGLAPPNSEELALGYWNRGNTLFALRWVEAALRDMGRACDAGFPPARQFKLEDLRARCLHALGRKEPAQIAKKEALRLLAAAGVAVPLAKVEAARRRLIGLATTRRKPSKAPTQKQVPALTGGQNHSIPGLSAHVGLRYSSERGRFLVATKDIEPGDVLITEKPLAAVLFDQYYATNCFHCMKRCLDMVPCQQCSLAMFCSELCRDESWSSYHRVECRVVPYLTARVTTGQPSTMLLLSQRLMLATCSKHGGLRKMRKKIKKLEDETQKRSEAECIFASDSSYDPGSLRATYFLPRVQLDRPEWPNQESLPEYAAHILLPLKQLTDFLVADSDGELAMFTGGLLLRFIAIRLNVNFGLGEYHGQGRQKIGNAVYAVSSLMNHSCDPNSFQTTFSGNVAVTIASRHIAAGEEILLSYGSSFAEKPLAQRRLEHAKYQFTCQCQACEKDWPLWREPLQSRSDFTIQCGSCNATFQGPLHRSSIKCTHCGRRVPILIGSLTMTILAQCAEKTGGNWKTVVDSMKQIQSILKSPNDMLVVVSEGMRSCFERMGNCCEDSW